VQLTLAQGVYTFGGVCFDKSKLEDILAVNHGLSPGTYLVAPLLLADPNPTIRKLQQFANASSSAPTDLVLPSSDWFSSCLVRPAVLHSQSTWSSEIVKQYFA
jgi:hypothetical protein